MFIQIAKNYFIDTEDGKNWVLLERSICTKGKNVGKEYTTPLAYCSTFEACCIRALRLKISKADAATLHEVKNVVKMAESELLQYLKEYKACLK